MLTYREYFNRMSAICSAFNTALNNIQVPNIAGLTEQETYLFLAGQYVMSMANSEHAVFSHNSVIFLLQLSKSVEGHFEFGMFPPDDVENEPEYEKEWRDTFNSYARMRKQTFIGKCFAMDPIIDYSGHTDITYWCSQQAEHLADYCVSHDIDRKLLAIING